MNVLASCSALVVVAASLVAAEPAPRGTPAPLMRRQALPVDFGQFTSFTDNKQLSSYYAQATSALSEAASAGLPSSIVQSQRSSLDSVFSSAYAAISKSGTAGGGAGPTATSGGGSGGGSSGAKPVHGRLDLPVSLALTGAAGMLAAILVL